MKKIMIVDDEYYFRQGFRTIFDWQSRGYDSFCEARNGKEALEVVVAERPDLIFLDIRMPIMDGMAFLEQYSQFENRVPVVILTGFSEFAYAQQAVKYGACDYLLKIVKWEDITAVLDRLEQQSEQQNPRIIEMDYQTKQLLRDKLMSDIVSGDLNILTQDEESYSQFLSFCPDAKQMRTVVVSLMQQSGWQKTDMQLWRYAVSNILEELVGQSFGCQVFNIRDNQLAAIIWDSTDHSIQNTELLAELCTDITQVIEKQLKFKAYFGIGSLCGELDKLKASFEGACAAAGYALMTGVGSVAVQTDNSSSTLEPIFRAHEKNNLLIALRMQDRDAVSSIVMTLLDRLKGSQGNAMKPEFIVEELRAVAVEAAAGMVGGRCDSLLSSLVWRNDMSLDKQLGSLCSSLVSLCDVIAGSTVDKLRSQMIVDKVKSFIKANYHRSELNETEIADYVFVNRTHLCAIFKNTTKTTIFKYINDVRMQHARELFDSGCTVIQDVSWNTGFADPNYFSKSFKKHTGMSPSQYIASVSSKK